jgi:hypothetical protein
MILIFNIRYEVFIVLKICVVGCDTVQFGR